MFVFEVAVQVEKGKAALRNFTALSALTIPTLRLFSMGQLLEIARTIKTVFAVRKDDLCK